jgi:hypothetical protein
MLTSATPWSATDSHFGCLCIVQRNHPRNDYVTRPSCSILAGNSYNIK